MWTPILAGQPYSDVLVLAHRRAYKLAAWDGACEPEDGATWRHAWSACARRGGWCADFSEDRNMLFGGNVVTNDMKVKLMKSPERPDQAPKSASLSMMGPSNRSEALVALGKNPVPELG